MELQIIQNKIYEIRGQRVMLDFDLADLYETETKRLKESVRRNIECFPSDFMFELTNKEYDSLRSQIEYLKNSGRGEHRKYLPFAFTEQGVAMLASVLKSNTAIQVNIQIIRAFVILRQFALGICRTKPKVRNLYARNQYAIQRYLSVTDRNGKPNRKRQKTNFANWVLGVR